MRTKNPFRHIKEDLSASIVVFLVALPLCLGIALASDAPLFSGIISGIIGGVIVGFVSKSPLSVSGPAAGLAAIVAVQIQDIGSFQGFLLAVIIAGVFQVLLGVLRLGVIANFFPSATIKGMLVSIGLLLIIKQLPHAMGYDVEVFVSEEFINMITRENTLSAMLKAIDHIEVNAVIISVICLFVLILWERPFMKKIKIIPAGLVAVILSVLINVVMENVFALELEKKHLVNIPVIDSWNDLNTVILFPDFSFLQQEKIWIAGLTIGFIASLESLLSIGASDKLDPHKRETPLSRELIAQGIGNISSGLVGGLPVTAVIVRTSVNIESGAKTKLSAILHGFLLVICVLGIPHILNRIPLASLATILLYTGYKLAKPRIFKETYKQGWNQFTPFIVTVLVVLFTDLLRGIAAGVLISGFFILRDNYKNFATINEFKQTDTRITIRLADQMTFLNKARFREVLQRIPEDSHVVIDGSYCRYLDFDVIEVIDEFKQTAAYKDITLELINIPDANKGKFILDLRKQTITNK
jgi:MFS superfamily sulfate permease-like transporter